MIFYNLLLRNRKEFLILLFPFVFYIWFVLKYLTVEVLFLASFYTDIPIVGKYLGGILEIKELIYKFGEHGMLGYNFLLLLNASLFDYTVYFDTVTNFIVVLSIALIFLVSYLNNIEQKNRIYFFGLLLISLILFTTMQGTSASMETQVRVGLFFFVWSSYLINKLIKTTNSKLSFYFFIISIIFTINIFGTMYNFAGYPIVFLCLLFLYFFRGNRKAILILIIYSLCLIGYVFEYNLFSNNSPGGSISNNLIYLLNNPILFLNSIVAYYGSSLLGWSTYADKIIIANNYLFIGYIIFSINILSIIFYFKSRMFKETYLPIFLHGYTLFVIILVLIGRANYMTYWDWGINSWYQVHTKIGLASSVWIFIYTFNNLSKNKFIRIIILISLFVYSISIIFGTYNDLKRAPYIKNWYLNFQKWMFVDINEMPINLNNETPLLASYEKTKKGLEILKRYNLSVFRNIIYQTKIDSSSELLSGKLYNDAWCTSNLKMNMNSKNGVLNIDLFLPNDYFTPNSLDIFINGVSLGKQYLKKSGLHHIEYKTEPNKDVIVKAIFEKSIIPKKFGLGEDERELSAIINKFEFE